jgi:hypothetical protein
VLDEEYAPRPVNDQPAHAERKSARETPINMEEAPNDGIERTAHRIQSHGAISRASQNVPGKA